MCDTVARVQLALPNKSYFSVSLCLLSRLFFSDRVPRVWFGLVWFGLVWFGLVWFGLVWFGLVWFGLVWFGLVWFGLVWFGLVWFGLVWFGLVWFGLVWLRTTASCNPELSLSVQKKNSGNCHFLQKKVCQRRLEFSPRCQSTFFGTSPYVPHLLYLTLFDQTLPLCVKSVEQSRLH